MSDFKFSDEDAPVVPPAPLQTPISAPPVTKNEELPEKPSEFQFFENEKPAPPLKTPAPIPTPSIPNPAIPNPAIPNLPKTAAVPPAQAQRPAPQPQSAAPARPSVPTPPQNAAANLPGSNAARPIPLPIPTAPKPSISLPIETVTVRPAAVNSRESEGAPQDDFSFKIWSVGQNIKRGLDSLEEPVSWILRVSLVIGVAALAYLLAGTFLGKAGNLTDNPNAAALTKNLNLCSQALMISLLAASVAAILTAYEDNRLGFGIGAIGVLFHFIAPFALKKFVGDSAATAAMASHFRHYGYFLVMIGLVKGVGDVAAWLWNLPEQIKKKHATVGVANQAETKQRIIAREANMFSPCWKLPFCRESIRKACPAFLAKTTCWKFGRGCYCDSEMISRIVRGESLDVIKAPTKQSTQGKAPCGRCYIYLEHQTYKFRLFSPLALPATVLLSWLSWPIYTAVFHAFNKSMDIIWSSVSFNSAKLTPDALQTSTDSLKEISKINANSEDVMLIAQNLIGVIFGFLLLIYISKFIEWAIFKAKL